MSNQLHLHRPSVREKLTFLFAGIISSAPFPLVVDSVISFYLFLNWPYYQSVFILTVIAAPIVEELAKIYPLFYRHGETKKSLLTLAFYVGLGFGITEFIFYVFLAGVPFYYRLPGIFFHASSVIISAFGVGKHQFLRYFLLSIFLHAGYNFLILTAQLDHLRDINSIMITILAFSFVAITYVLAIIFYNRAPEEKIDNI